jgi:hypothetical protein
MMARARGPGKGVTMWGSFGWTAALLTGMENLLLELERTE